MASESYCYECDAPPGGCSHHGRRYLSPIKYERVGESPDGRPIWKVPTEERWRFDNPPSSWERQRLPSDHDAPPHVRRERREPETYSVTTTSGNAMRLLGLQVNRRVMDRLLALSKTRRLTRSELVQLDDAAGAITHLQAMAPAGPLERPRAGLDFGSTSADRHFQETGHRLAFGCCAQPDDSEPRGGPQE